MDKKLRQLVLSALFAALTCVATMVIQIRVPLTGGYLHFGDCFVVLSGWVLGPVWGALAAGVGSAMADMLTGYALYAPATLIIKAAVALVAALVFAVLRKGKAPQIAACIVSSIAGELVMVGGYFLYSFLVMGNALAVVVESLPADAIQATSGVVAGTVLMTLIGRLKLLERW